LSCVADHILQEFNTLFLNRFRTYKVPTPAQIKIPVKTTFSVFIVPTSMMRRHNLVTRRIKALGSGTMMGRGR
jgi:hypothetical protein